MRHRLMLSAFCLLLLGTPASAQSLGVFQRGDANGDQTNDLGDAITVLGFLFPPSEAVPTLPCAKAADVNDDGTVDIGDGIQLLGVLFGSSSAMIPAPFPSCGWDPTPDALDCDSSPCGPLPIFPCPLPIPAGFALRGDIDTTGPPSEPWSPNGCLFDDDFAVMQFILQWDEDNTPAIPGEPDMFFLLDQFGVPSCVLDMDGDGVIDECDFLILYDSLYTSGGYYLGAGLLDLSDPGINDCVVDPTTVFGEYGTIPSGNNCP